MSRALSIALALLCLAGTAAGADVYKWVDANGVTQYGAAPPPGVKATPVGTPPAVDPATASQAAAAASKAKADAARGAAEIAGDEARRQAERTAERLGRAAGLRRCAVARQQLEAVTKGGPVFRFDARGGRVYLADDARDGEIGRLRGEVAALCAGLESDPATRERWREIDYFVACMQTKGRLQAMEQHLAQTPQQDLDRARRAVADYCAASRFPPGTGTHGEWFNAFR